MTVGIHYSISLLIPILQNVSNGNFILDIQLAMQLCYHVILSHFTTIYLAVCLRVAAESI